MRQIKIVVILLVVSVAAVFFFDTPVGNHLLSFTRGIAGLGGSEFLKSQEERLKQIAAKQRRDGSIGDSGAEIISVIDGVCDANDLIALAVWAYDKCTGLPERFDAVYETTYAETLSRIGKLDQTSKAIALLRIKTSSIGINDGRYGMRISEVE